MIVLDTNVISELMRGPQADSNVRRWFADLAELPVTTVLNQAEILTGIELLPPGARRKRLRAMADAAFSRMGTALPLTPGATGHYARIVALRTKSGREIGTMDALIAAIVLDAAAVLVTRDHDFDGLGLSVINPWGDQPGNH